MCCKHDLSYHIFFFTRLGKSLPPLPPASGQRNFGFCASLQLLNMILSTWELLGSWVLVRCLLLNGSNNSTTCQLLQLNIAINMLQSLMRVLKLVSGFCWQKARMTNSRLHCACLPEWLTTSLVAAAAGKDCCNNFHTTWLSPSTLPNLRHKSLTGDMAQSRTCLWCCNTHKTINWFPKRRSRALLRTGSVP